MLFLIVLTLLAQAFAHLENGAKNNHQNEPPAAEQIGASGHQLYKFNVSGATKHLLNVKGNHSHQLDISDERTHQLNVSGTHLRQLNVSGVLPHQFNVSGERPYRFNHSRAHPHGINDSGDHPHKNVYQGLSKNHKRGNIFHPRPIRSIRGALFEQGEGSMHHVTQSSGKPNVDDLSRPLTFTHHVFGFHGRKKPTENATHYRHKQNN
ncbi:Hypothetical predicted protein [Pelobates cultripes]|uniref:Uncharacterized protein n=1 Tax=Pelobates cultripes TaxID=61616 RepID=A0AAD1WZX2_PELCU|nr:Hypothetical predicted protein [Pelobates cultripes]